MHYLPAPPEDYVEAAVNATLQVHFECGPGDILVFLTGQEEIEGVERVLTQRANAARDALLHARAARKRLLDDTGGGAAVQKESNPTEEADLISRYDASRSADPFASAEQVLERDLHARILAHTPSVPVREGADTGAPNAAKKAKKKSKSNAKGSGEKDKGADGTASGEPVPGSPPSGMGDVGDGGGPPLLMVCPIFAALAPELQMRAFEPAPPGHRKVILATNIAETSVTINGVRFVIDPGFVKARGFSSKLGVDSLQVVPISQAQARQRSGRAGREAAGAAFRLYTEEAFHEELPETTAPEILRSNLGAVVLQLKALGVDDILAFEFIDPPPRAAVLRALEMLFALGALAR